ncbi:putative ATP-dependent helicase DinG [Oenococcus sicerae]|nr:putative ATP-dependent helicase DinG [Oenococcus sicerae]
MDENSTFAIVDLETTAPFKEDGHIIQIGISFVKKWKIINNFQTMVNPGVKIPNQIVDLTGIKNEDVQDAPYFEDLAAMIHDQLSEAVFVAHNVRYDFPYLNGEFTRIKMHRLRVEYVDTVQLAQIIFPTIPSYKLDELVQHLGIKLPRHHRADQDAHATAQLFLKIHEQIGQLPDQTLATLLDHSVSLLGNTEKIFLLPRGRHRLRITIPSLLKHPRFYRLQKNSCWIGFQIKNNSRIKKYCHRRSCGLDKRHLLIFFSLRSQIKKLMLIRFFHGQDLEKAMLTCCWPTSLPRSRQEY